MTSANIPEAVTSAPAPAPFIIRGFSESGELMYEDEEEISGVEKI